MYIVWLMASGAASCPRNTPVENVQGGLKLRDVRRIDLVQSTVSGARIALGGHDPLIVIGLQLQEIRTHGGLLRLG
jgi:hypothetical protein